MSKARGWFVPPKNVAASERRALTAESADLCASAILASSAGPSMHFRAGPRARHMLALDDVDTNAAGALPAADSARGRHPRHLPRLEAHASSDKAAAPAPNHRQRRAREPHGVPGRPRGLVSDATTASLVEN